eukprot:GHUV01033533.1.p1 GENE.GHUV01033533.1~~GHUV01033533.1.p1  ORF type:complete len:408 (+),score=134.88 GHUV01033533.1:179-1402(+)
MGTNLVTYVSHIGEGLHNIAEVSDLHNNTAVKSLNLHSNAIQHIGGLDHLRNLSNLNLSSNNIQVIENLSSLVNLTNLNLSSNCIVELRGLAGLSRLQQVNVSYNTLTSIAGISDLHGRAGSLQKLNIQHNNLSTLQSLAPLAGCLQLQQLKVGGNPCTLSQAAYAALRQVLPQVQQLDESEAASLAMSWQLAHAQLQAFHQSTQQLQYPQLDETEQPSRAAKKQAREDPRRLPQARARPAEVLQEPATAGYPAQALSTISTNEDSSSPEAQSSADLLDLQPVSGAAGHQQQPPAALLAQQYRLPDEEEQQQRKSRRGNSSRARPAREGAASKAVVVEAGAQTDAYTPPVVEQLRKEAQVMREQLAKLIGECPLERLPLDDTQYRRRSSDRQLQQWPLLVAASVCCL